MEIKLYANTFNKTKRTMQLATRINPVPLKNVNKVIIQIRTIINKIKRLMKKQIWI